MQQFDQAGDLELRDYVEILRRRWAWALVPLVAVPLLAAIYSTRQADVFQATARVLLADSAAQDAIDSTSDNSFSVSREMANEINLAESDATRAAVAETLGIDVNDLPSGAITADGSADVLDFRFSSPTPEGAADAANTWADVYVQVKQETAQSSISRTVEQLETALDDLRVERSDLRAPLEALEDRLARAPEEQRATLQLQVDREASSISGDLNLIDDRIASNISSITTLQLEGELAAQGTAQVFQVAAPPQEPVNAPASRNVILGLVVGAILGAGAAILRDNLDQTISSTADVERLGYPILGAIPKASKELRRSNMELAALNSPDTPLADAYQKVRTALQFAAMDGEIRSIVVTSPLQGEGKTTTSSNLAIAFATVGNQVILADTDLRRPRIHGIYGTKLSPGLTDVLIDDMPLNEVAIHLDGLNQQLAALPAGSQPPNPSSFLSSSSFAKLAEELRIQADLVVFDAPPVLPVSDALSISQHTDGVLVVASAGTTKRSDLTAAIETITRAGGKLLGVVVVGTSSGGRYGKKYEYYADDKPDPYEARPLPRKRQARSAKVAVDSAANGTKKATGIASRPAGERAKASSE